MVREGLFDDVDIVLHWHPDDVNSQIQEHPIQTNLLNLHLMAFHLMLLERQNKEGPH